MVIPKFKVPDFDKYKGTTCSKNHLKMYCRKMGAYAKDEELLIHSFQENLTGVAVTWYTNLEPSRVHSWKDLMVAFVRQYRYNCDMVPNRMQLQNMWQKGEWIFQRMRPKVEGSGSPSGTPKDGKGDDNRNGRHITSILL